MALSDQTKERLFQAIIGLIIALTVYFQNKQTQERVKKSENLIQKSFVNATAVATGEAPVQIAAQMKQIAKDPRTPLTETAEAAP